MSEEILNEEVNSEVDAEGTETVITAENSETVENKSISVNDEEIDEIADYAIEAIQNVVSHFNLGNFTIDEYEGEEGELILDISGDNMSVLIGKHGATLDALQVVVTSIIHTKKKFRMPVIVDVEGYKSRQKEKLEALAISTANKVASRGYEIKMRPMRAYERRIIHMALRDDDRVETVSEGEGRNRRLIIYPVQGE